MLTHPTFIPRSQVIDALVGLRHEWEQAADGASLTRVLGSVGLFLADLSVAIGLSPEEMVQALGAELVDDLQGALVTAPGNNGHH